MQGLTDMYLQGRIFDAEMCWQGRIFDAEMCWQGRIFNAVFAVFCAVFRRGERGWASGDVLAGTVFDAGFAVFCAGFRRGERGCGERGCFFKIVGLRINIGVTLW